MIASLVLALGLFAGSEFPDASVNGSQGERAQVAASQMAVVIYGQDLGLRDRLLRVADVRVDSAGYVVAKVDPGLVPALERRGASVVFLDPGEAELWLVPLDHMDLIPDGQARILWQPADRGPAIVAIMPAAKAVVLAALAAGGHGHCGLGAVSDRAMVPAPPLRWRGLEGRAGVDGLAQRSAGGTIAATAGDPRIATLVADVNKANLSARVQDLSSLFTRRADQPGAVTAQGNIEGWLLGHGLMPTTQQFSSTYSKNVVAEIAGATSPEKIIVIGAHYDSVNWADGATASSPGADDNASGTSGVIEAARVLLGGGPYENTIRFVLFSGEEFGLLGSDYNAAQSSNSGEEIVAMLNMDMISYRKAGDTRDVDFATNNTSASLNNFCDAIGALYVPSWASQFGVLTAGSSDHAAYTSYGFPAAFLFEDLTDFYPAIHTATDSFGVSAVDFDLAKMCVQAVVATAATLAEPVDMTVVHSPLADTLDGVGPYLVSANVSSQTAANVSFVDLHFSADGQNWTTVPMADVGAGNYQGLIPGLGSPVTIQYWIEARDDAGGSEVNPTGAELGGLSHGFFVGQKTVLYASNFDGQSDDGWTHGQIATQDDWQRGAPQGNGGDPSAAYSGDKVWGNDLGNSGFNGIYQPNVSNWLRSPAIDATGTTSLSLDFQRWLTVEDATFDQAQVLVNGQVVWENVADAGGSDHTIDTAWQAANIDISTFAGSPSVVVEFKLLSDGGLEFGGWNIDDFSVAVVGPAPAPPAPSFTISPSQVPAIGGQLITAAGMGMGAVQVVTVGGVSVAFEQGAGMVTFQAPPATSLGNAAVVVSTAVGSGQDNLVVNANGGTSLSAPNTANLGDLIQVTVGSPEPALAWLAYSVNPGPTPLPGLVNLSIGSGDALSLKVLKNLPVNAAGNLIVNIPVPSAPVFAGLQVYFEGVTAGSGTGIVATGASPFMVQ